MASGTGIGWFFRAVPLLLWRGSRWHSATLPLHSISINVLLHGVNAYLVAALGSAMGMRRRTSRLGWRRNSFLAFPALPEAVAWTAGIQDVLMTTMALGRGGGVGRASHPGGRRIAIVCVLLILGLASKETAICIPATHRVLLADAVASQSATGHALRWRSLLVTVVYLAIRLPMGIGGEYLAAPSRYFFKQMIGHGLRHACGCRGVLRLSDLGSMAGVRRGAQRSSCCSFTRCCRGVAGIDRCTATSV